MRRPVDPPVSITTEFGVPDSNALFKYHSGIDYSKGTGTNVYAPAGGIVRYARFHSVRGNMVGIFDGTNTHRLMHNSAFRVTEGQRVVEGQVVALSGSTGLSIGPHVHWDILKGDDMDAEAFSNFINPWEWLNSAPAPPAPAPPVVAIQPYQRRVGANGVNHRTGPNRGAEIIQEFPADDIVNFKGWVKGENVDGNDIWFVGRFKGGYCWSGSFTDTGTHDLEDMNTKLQGFQRQVGSDSVNYRKAPQLDAEILRTFTPGEILDFDGWTRGANVEATDIWFRGKHTGGWSHASGFTDRGTHDLTEVSLAPPVTPVEPTPPDLTKQVIDISSHNRVTDYEALKKTVRSVIAKAGHTGKTYGGIQPLNSDPSFATSKAALGDKLSGAYWYGYASLDPIVEANAFVQTVGSVSPKFTYWLDIEELDGRSATEVNVWAKRFMERVDELTGKSCGMYMNRNWFDNTIYEDTKTTRHIWLAHYGTSEFSNAVPNQVAHQYTSSGSASGVEGSVDLNYVRDAFFEPILITPKPDPVVDPPKPDPIVPKPDPVTPHIPSDTLFLILTSIAKFFTDIANLLKKKN